MPNAEIKVGPLSEIEDPGCQESIGWFGFFLYAAALGIPSIVLSIIVVRYSKTERPA